jgi:hypothetical protein
MYIGSNFGIAHFSRGNHSHARIGEHFAQILADCSLRYRRMRWKLSPQQGLRLARRAVCSSLMRFFSCSALVVSLYCQAVSVDLTILLVDVSSDATTLRGRVADAERTSATSVSRLNSVESNLTSSVGRLGIAESVASATSMRVRAVESLTQHTCSCNILSSQPAKRI